jgi:ABC-type cobalamin/Fe3+-siderophores transport system ATPase subunit
MAETTAPPFVSFRGVKKSFGDKVVYDGLDVDVIRGETLTVLGPSGCGKSVMLKMLIGLIGYDEGSITFDGAEVNTMGREALSQLPKELLKRTCSCSSSDWRQKISTGQSRHSRRSSAIASAESSSSSMRSLTCSTKSGCNARVSRTVEGAVILGSWVSGTGTKRVA